MKRVFVSLVSAAVAAAAFSLPALAQDAERVLEHTGPAASPGSAGSTGGMDTTVSGIGIGATGLPSLSDVHGPNEGLPSREEAGVIADYSGGASGIPVAANSTGAAASNLGIAGTGATGADPQRQSSP